MTGAAAPLANGRTVCIVGVWHLGAVTAACLAELGYSVVGVDPDAARVEGLGQGRAPLFEPGLDDMLARNLEAGRLRFTTDLAGAVARAAYVLITYDTPVDENDEVDLSGIEDTFERLAGAMSPDTTVIVSSQVPVGTCQRLAETLRGRSPSLPFGIACIPENLRLGQAIERFLHPDMLVVGVDGPATQERVEALLAPIPGHRTVTDLPTAEMTKHAINAYLSTAISFGNELANLCDEVGADALTVIEALRQDARVSPRAPLLPGLAFGGGTLARDMKVLRRIGQETGYAAPLINGVLEVNRQQNGTVLRHLRRFYPSLQGLTVGVLGLTYKAGTSTLRRSPAVEIIQLLHAEGVTVRAYDPKADPAEAARYSNLLHREDDPYDVAQGSDALALVTPWPEFGDLDYGRIGKAMRRPVLLDPLNTLDPVRMEALGFEYRGTGRGKSGAARGKGTLP